MHLQVKIFFLSFPYREPLSQNNVSALAWNPGSPAPRLRCSEAPRLRGSGASVMLVNAGSPVMDLGLLPR